jgi:hypothetical protein
MVARVARSRVSNGNKLLAGIDQRSATARRFRDLIAGLTAELGDNLGEADQLRVRSAAALTIHAERLAADMLNGKPIDSEELTRVNNSASRILGELRGERRRR